MSELIRCRWPNATVVPFGSFPAGLSTFTSDIDITVHNTDSANEQSTTASTGNKSTSYAEKYVTDLTHDDSDADDEGKSVLFHQAKTVSNSESEAVNLEGTVQSSEEGEHESTTLGGDKTRKFELDLDHDMMFNVTELVQVPVTNSALDRDIIVHVESGSDEDSDGVREHDLEETDAHWSLQQPDYKSVIDLSDADDVDGMDNFQIPNKASLTPVERKRELELKKLAVEELRSLFPHMVVSRLT